MHGLKDNIAPYTQSVELFSKLGKKAVGHMSL